MDERRRRARHGPGRAPPPQRRASTATRARRGQVFDPIGASETLERAGELIGYGQELPDGRGDRRRVRLVAVVPERLGRVREAQRRRLAARSSPAPRSAARGAVMALPILAAEVLGHASPRSSRSSTRTPTPVPGTWARPARRRRSTTAAPSSTPPSEIRDQLLKLAAEELEADRGGPRAGRRHASRSRARPTARVTIAELAATAHGGELLLGKGSGTPPPTRRRPTPSSCVGALGHGVVRRAPRSSRHAVRVQGRPRDRRRARARGRRASHDSGTIVNPIGADGQVDGGVVMGIGQALSEGTQFDDDGRQRNPYLLDYKLQTAADVPPISDRVGRRSPPPTAGRSGSKGVGEPPCVPTPGAIANAIAKVIGAPRPAAADDARARLGASCSEA